MISLRLHNSLDYIIGFFLVLTPWFFDFADLQIATNIYLILGTALIVYSLFTNYEFAIAQVIPLGTHMALDAGLGLVLVLAPWLFNYRGMITGTQEMVHYLLGALIMALVFLTHPRSEHEREEIDLGHLPARHI